jgi:hypothetical protein
MPAEGENLALGHGLKAPQAACNPDGVKRSKPSKTEVKSRKKRTAGTLENGERILNRSPDVLDSKMPDARKLRKLCSRYQSALRNFLKKFLLPLTPTNRIHLFFLHSRTHINWVSYH